MTSVHDLLEIDAIVERALREDVQTGDVTSEATIRPETTAIARFLVKEDGVLSGVVPATRAFELIDPDVEVAWSVSDGSRVRKGDHIGTVSGSARAILTSERTALNLLQRMSGIATLTSEMAAEARPYGARILDTRKTAPGLRMLDKLAVLHGGGTNHRIGLFDMILIKDNHIAAAGSIQLALERARQFRSRQTERNLQIEIEARTLDEVAEVVAFWNAHAVPDRILLDNMARRNEHGAVDTTMLAEAVGIIAGRIETEASGNVELGTVAAIATTGVNYISSGALTHSVKALDVSLEIELNLADAS